MALLAEVYRGAMGVERDLALVALFEYRAAQKGICPDGTRLVEGLVQGNENVCVQMDDRRQ
ncbi:MAG: hypothetical protein R3F14_01385 [Polyangiaceae bacterium]